jgi:NTE family protein
MEESYTQDRRIGLALSGGGVRAAAFHAGVLHWLAEQGRLEEVKHISSVSGGSLFTGLVFHAAGYRWPTSEEYLQVVFPHIKKVLTQTSLQRDAICRLILNPLNWKFILSPANVLADSIEKLWGIQSTLGQLPQEPLWSINGTTAENGKRFRFKNAKGGDYEMGYADFRNFGLAKAMAVSAAFPGGIGPLALEVQEYQWQKRESWNSSHPPSDFLPPFTHLHLYDGGLYDNLGIEPLFDIGRRTIKDSAGDIDFIIISDAGAPFTRLLLPKVLRWRRLKRFMDIVMEQARSLRVRAFVNFLQQNPSAGMYLQIGSLPIEGIQTYSSTNNCDDSQKPEWLSYEEVKIIASLPTTLRQMREQDFDSAVKHGRETAYWNDLAFSPFLDMRHPIEITTQEAV